MAPARARDYTLDETACSALVICNHCRARFLATSRPAAVAELLEHLRLGHPGTYASARVMRAQRPGPRARA